MALLIVYDATTAIQEHTIRRPFPLRISEESEFRGLSSIFGAARKYGSGWIGQVILIGWKCSATLTVKLNYAPNKNTSLFLLHITTTKLFSLIRNRYFKPYNCLQTNEYYQIEIIIWNCIIVYKLVLDMRYWCHITVNYLY